MLAQQEHLGRPAGAALCAQKACRHDPRLVGHQKVAGAQVLRDVAEYAVLQRAGHAVHDQQAAAVAFRGGLLGYELFGQVVVEIGGLHAGGSFVRFAVGSSKSLL